MEPGTKSKNRAFRALSLLKFNPPRKGEKLSPSPQ